MSSLLVSGSGWQNFQSDLFENYKKKPKFTLFLKVFLTPCTTFIIFYSQDTYILWAMGGSIAMENDAASLRALAILNDSAPVAE